MYVWKCMYIPHMHKHLHVYMDVWNIYINKYAHVHAKIFLYLPEFMYCIHTFMIIFLYGTF